MQCRDAELFTRLAQRAQRIAAELDPQGLAIVAWSFATVGRCEEQLLRRIAEEARKKLEPRPGGLER